MLFIEYYNEIIQPNIILIMFISKYQLYVFQLFNILMILKIFRCEKWNDLILIIFIKMKYIEL